VTFSWTSKRKSPRVQGRSHAPLAFHRAQSAHYIDSVGRHAQVHAAAGRSTIYFLLLPRVQQNPLHPFGGVKTR
jgi:hypothetical protein